MTPEAVDERAAALDLPRPHDRPMRKSGPRGWSIADVQRFIALWLDNAATKSIAASIARSTGSLYYKRKWLGLESRTRSELRQRSLEECAATPLLWTPLPAVDTIAAPTEERAVGLQERPKREERWNSDRSKRCSSLAFAGLSNGAIAARMTLEFGLESGVAFTAKAIADQLCRLQVFRDRSTRSVEFIADDEIEPRAEAFIAVWGMQWRKCDGTTRNFWYSRARGGPRNTCRAFQMRQKYAGQRQDRECTARFGGA